MRPFDSGEDEVLARLRVLLEADRQTEAYAQVVTSTKDVLYRFLRGFFRKEDEAREVFQETYLRVFRALAGFRGESSLRTWVLTIGRHAALNWIRSRQGRKMRRASLDDPAASFTTVEQKDLGELSSLQAAVEALPAAQQEAVRLFYLEELSLNEVATVTGRPLNTLKSDLRRARAHLKRSLES